MTVAVPQDSNKRKVLSTEAAHRNKHQHTSGKPKGHQKDEGMLPPPQSVPVGMTMPVCGGVEAYNK